MGAVLLAPPILGPWASDTKSKKLGDAILGTPHFGSVGGTCPFLQFLTPEHQRTTWTNLTPTDTQPLANKPTYLGANIF